MCGNGQCDHDESRAKWMLLTSSDVVYRRIRKMWQLHVQPIDPYARVRVEAFKYVGNLWDGRDTMHHPIASAVAASKPISARGY